MCQGKGLWACSARWGRGTPDDPVKPGVYSFGRAGTRRLPLLRQKRADRFLQLAQLSFQGLDLRLLGLVPTG
jgi:hypothetical protein